MARNVGVAPSQGRGAIAMVGQQNPPAGWYPDPAGGGGRRYWDGGQWMAVAPPPSTGTNGFAIAALFFGIIGLFPLALIFGVLALREIRRRGSGGRGLAIAGLAAAGVWGFLITAVIAINIVSPIPDESGTASSDPNDNGVSALPPAQIAASAAQALSSASSVRVSGLLRQVDGQSEMEFDVRSQGGSRAGTMTIDGQSVEVIAIGETAYVKADQSIWRSFQDVDDLFVTRLGDKYLRVNTNDPRFGRLTALPLPEALIEILLGHADETSKGDRRVVNGVPAIGLIDPQGSVLYVATQGPPYPVRLDGGANGAIDFRDYGKAFDINEPPDDQVVDISTLA